jgi:hypothetical protein
MFWLGRRDERFNNIAILALPLAIGCQIKLIMTTFEPPGVLISHSSHAKTRPKRRVYAWLGWRDSNPRMSAPKADALPLGDTPSVCFEWLLKTLPI